MINAEEAAKRIGMLEVRNTTRSWERTSQCDCGDCWAVREACGDQRISQTALVLACVMYAQDVAEGRHR